MSEANTVEVQIKASVQSLVDGMKQASGVVHDSSQQMADDLAAAGGAANEATSPFGRLTEVLRDYRHEMKSEGRYARFMAADIASMGIASKGAAGEITGFVSALAFGGGLGVAIEVVKTAIKMFTELSAEEKKATDEFREWVKQGDEAVAHFREGVTETIMRMQGASESEMLAHKEIKPMLEERGKLLDQLAAKQADLARERVIETEEDIAKFAAEEEGDRESIKRLQEKIEKLNEWIEKKKAAAGDVAGQEKKDDDSKEAEDAAKEADRVEKIEEQHSLRMMALRAQLEEGTAKIRSEGAIKLQQIRDNDDLDESQKAEELAATKAGIEKQVTDFEAAELDKREKAIAKHYDWQAKMAAEAAAAEQKYFDEKLKERVKADEELTKKINEEAKKAAHAWMTGFVEPFVHGFAGAVRGIIEGTKSLAAAMKEIFDGLINALIDGLAKMAIKAIESALIKKAADSLAASAGVGSWAAEGGAAAAAAAAPMFWWDPGAAIAIGAAMDSSILGAFLPSASAAGGYDIPSGINPIVQTHASEMILPAHIADGIRSMVARGGTASDTGGGDVHLHLNVTGGVVDGASIQRVFRDPVTRGEIVRAVRDLNRTGRL